MFARFFTVAFLAALAFATPLTLRDGQCNTGDIQCCQSSTTTSNYNKAAKSLGLAEIAAGIWRHLQPATYVLQQQHNVLQCGLAHEGFESGVQLLTSRNYYATWCMHEGSSYRSARSLTM
ncbi:hypothetical protein EDB19DRAFT_1827765 [Suillus lakei]|nr:hypothetical protein EDB19DRAFT_1827765 [Suillus lakei]